MNPSASIGIALGSNQGDRMKHLQAGIDWLKCISTTPIQCSQIYETSPVDCAADTPSFLNAVCEISSNLEPLDLLRQMRDFERKQGRPASYTKNSPRPLDLDMLYFGDKVMNTEELTLPHPRMLERCFVLQPLCDIHPALVLPGSTQPIQKLLSFLDTTETIRPYKPL